MFKIEGGIRIFLECLPPILWWLYNLHSFPLLIMSSSIEIEKENKRYEGIEATKAICITISNPKTIHRYSKERMGIVSKACLS